jgi:hypothetical protein
MRLSHGGADAGAAPGSAAFAITTYLLQAIERGPFWIRN